MWPSYSVNTDANRRAFGRVVAGMEVVRKIQKQPAEGQNLKSQVKITSIRRIEQ